MASDSEHSDSDLSDDEIDEIDPISPSSGLTEVDKSHFNNDCTLSDALRRCFATTGRQGTIESDIHLGVNDGDPDFNMAWSSLAKFYNWLRRECALNSIELDIRRRYVSKSSKSP
jgi:hypothetical protein